MILADDLGWVGIGCYGSEIPTPHLEADRTEQRDLIAEQPDVARRLGTAWNDW